MSRSYRKIPIFGHATSRSQKNYRSQENRAKRRKVTVLLHQEKEIMPAEKEYGNEWGSPRDGQYYGSFDDYKSRIK